LHKRMKIKIKCTDINNEKSSQNVLFRGA
jgi:hypothetical protein